ncbi:MAG: hypothetical protein QOC93_3278 [Actinomycetota bacterium]|jgi:hypothetical protein|nr:hypothetical protein [Cryptosporangiaceae bacterium]MDQ1678134.1 hypothetical protein [Actinomycetota bacterium]
MRRLAAQVRTLARRLDDWTLYAYNAQPPVRRTR